MNEEIEQRMAGEGLEEEEAQSKKIDGDTGEAELTRNSVNANDSLKIHLIKPDRTDDVEESDEETKEDEDPETSPWPCSEKFFISESSEFRKRWEIAIMVLALYNATLIPLQLFFQPNPGFIDNDYIKCTDAVVDLLFLIDIIFEFRTTRQEPTEISPNGRADGHVIAKKYIKDRFILDLISSVPFNALFNTDTVFLDLLGLLKLLRIGRITPIIRKMNAPQHIKVYLQMGRMFLFILIALHVLCCIWHAVVSTEEAWVQNMDFMYVYQDRAYQSYWEDEEG